MKPSGEEAPKPHDERERSQASSYSRVSLRTASLVRRSHRKRLARIAVSQWLRFSHPALAALHHWNAQSVRKAFCVWRNRIVRTRRVLRSGLQLKIRHEYSLKRFAMKSFVYGRTVSRRMKPFLSKMALRRKRRFCIAWDQFVTFAFLLRIQDFKALNTTHFASLDSAYMLTATAAAIVATRRSATLRRQILVALKSNVHATAASSQANRTVVILGSCFKMWRRIRARKLSLRRIDAASSRRLTFRFFKALASFKAHMKAIVLSADAKYGIKTLAHTAAAFATWTRRARRLVDFRRLHDVYLSRRLFVALTSWGTWARKRRESVARHAALQHDFLVRSRRRVIQTLLRKLRAEIRQRADAMAVLASARHCKAVASRALRLWSDAAARTVKLRSASASVGGAVLDRKTRSVLASWRSASRRGRAARDMQARVVARSATSAFFLWLESLDDASSTARKRRIAKVADFRRATRRAILRWTLFRSYKFKRRTVEERAATARRATSKRNLFAHWGAFVELAQAKLQSKRQAARHFYFHTLAAVAAAWRERLEVAGMKRRIGAKVRRRREKALAQRVLNLWRSALGALVEKRLFEARVGHIFDRVLMRGVLRRWGQGLVLMALSRQSKHEADVAFASLLKRRSLCALAAISRQRRLARERAFEIVEAAEGFNKRRLRLFGWRGMNAYLKRRAHVRANKLIANDFIFKLAAKRSMEGWVRYARIARRLRDRLRSHLNSRAKLSARRSLAYLRAHSIARRELKEVVFCHARRCGAAFLHEAVLAWRLRAEAKGEERAAARAAIALCDEAMRRVACAHWLRAAEAKALLRQRVAIKAQLRKTERILARVVRFASHWRSLARLRAAARSSAREEELRGAGVAAEGVARASRLSNFLAPLPSMRPMRAAPTHSGDAQPLGLFSRPLVDPSVRPIREPPRVPPFFWDDGAISRPSPFGASPPNAQTEAPPPPVRAGPLRSRPLVQRHVSAFSSTSSSPVPSRRPSLDVNSDVGSQISAISRSESAEDGVRSDDGSDVDEGEIEEIAGVLGAYEEERRRYLGMNVEYERLGGVLEAMDRGVYGGGGYESEDEEESGLTEAQVATRMRHLRRAMAESNRRREEAMPLVRALAERVERLRALAERRS